MSISLTFKKEFNVQNSMRMFLFVSFLCFVPFIYSAPIETVMVDLTYTFEENIPRYPIVKPFNMTVTLNGSFAGIEWLQSEEINSPTHIGTHMDAPSHFIKGGLTIDQLPVSKFIAPAAVIRISHKTTHNPDAEVTVEDLRNWEKITGTLLNGMIVLVDSGWGKKWHNRTEFLGTSEVNDKTKLHFPGISAEAAQWLVDNRDIYGVGVDTVSFDKGSSTDFPAHHIILGKGLFGVENVANLDKIPIYGATVYVMPMKIGRASGASARVVATFPKILFHGDNHEHCNEN